MSAAIDAKWSQEFPIKTAIRLPKTPFFVDNEFLYRFLFFFYNVIPAFIMGTIMRKSTSIMKITREGFFGIHVISIFGKNIKYDDKNLVDMLSSMTAEDRKIFPCSERCPLIFDYLRDSVKGLQTYALNGTEQDCIDSKKRMKMFLIADYILSALFCFAVFCFVSIFFK